MSCHYVTTMMMSWALTSSLCHTGAAETSPDHTSFINTPAIITKLEDIICDGNNSIKQAILYDNLSILILIQTRRVHNIGLTHLTISIPIHELGGFENAKKMQVFYLCSEETEFLVVEPDMSVITIGPDLDDRDNYQIELVVLYGVSMDNPLK
ncbi:hypothetical protein K435DRAFT_800050 [Dendrothele bispora CBS 962.96]|uniref:Uncharacterized protein n=1 Tax=Dendrothele bispora (strain CBS 962.96) TaxID=1314807 RepID=A0A4S8LUL6_DENBC|nr:hypothetical protein K435DRAFT_800050 [Dendrothele bispora CBS 962.96]